MNLFKDIVQKLLQKLHYIHGYYKSYWNTYFQERFFVTIYFLNQKFWNNHLLFIDFPFIGLLVKSFMMTRAVRNNSTDKQACSYYSLLVRHFTSERVKRINKNNIQPLTTYFFDVCLHSYAAATIIFKIIFSAT